PQGQPQAQPHREQPNPMFQPSQPAAPAQEPVAPREPAGRPPRTVTFDEGDDLDVPDFLK
ncbi:MAG: cell division protein FtsZ, partial [Pedococcus sp.]